jgi:Uma2 family endonuclease
MVANTLSTDDRLSSASPSLTDRRDRLVRFTLKDVQAMVRAGIIPEDASTELLNGLIVRKDRSARGEDPITIGNDHRICVERMSKLCKLIDNPARHVESQQPLVCSETHQPEPDFMVLRGTLSDYTDLPVASDAYCVVEVADASYELDRGAKLASYARAGIGQYVILNIRNRTAEVYTGPDSSAGTYRSAQTIDPAGELSLRIGQEEFFGISMRDVLP